MKQQGFYTPYESPLTRFKAYRYHPQYSHSVSGGFKSLTYSHEIDPTKPVCPFETAGGICNDSACEGQHFRAMGISGALQGQSTPLPNPSPLNASQAPRLTQDHELGRGQDSRPIGNREPGTNSRGAGAVAGGPEASVERPT